MMVVNYLARKTGVLQEADSGLCAPRTGEEKHSLLNSWSSMQLHCWYLFMGLQPHVSLHPPFVLYQVHSFKHIFNLSNNGKCAWYPVVVLLCSYHPAACSLITAYYFKSWLTYF